MPGELAESPVVEIVAMQVMEMDHIRLAVDWQLRDMPRVAVRPGIQSETQHEAESYRSST
jgi:hypothetical protein